MDAHVPPPPDDREVLLPTRIRRLSNAEIENALSVLLGKHLELSERLPPDIRVDGFTQNDQTPVHSAWGARLAELAEELAEESSESITGCPAAEVGRSCRERLVNDLGLRAFRRPVQSDERDTLVAIYEGAQSDREGRTLLLQTLIQAPSTLYLSEKGEPKAPGPAVRLTPFEVASSLSFMLRGGPPDAELLESARIGTLLTRDERARQARRLLSLSETRHQFRRFVSEWLEIDRLDQTAKDQGLLRNYEEMKKHMLLESMAYVDEVMVSRGASLSALLNSGFSSVDTHMARFYGLNRWGPRVNTRKEGRLGLLQHASFLSAHAHSDGTSPIRRGDFVLRRLLCVELPRPAEIGIETVTPPVSEVKTTRDRFSVHTQNSGCRACHDAIDPLGFSFENFDAVGRFRSTENGQAVDAAGTFQRQELRVDFQSNRELIEWLSELPQAEACFRRYAFRFFTSQTDPVLDQGFERLVTKLPLKKRTSLIENLLAFAESDAFIYRRALE